MIAEKEHANAAGDELELAKWLIERYDNLRSSVANRAAFVLSADALVLAGASVLLGGLDDALQTTNEIEGALLLLGIGATFLLATTSTLFATTAIASVWRSSWHAVGVNRPGMLFFNPAATAEKQLSLEVFEQEYRKAFSAEQMLHHALGELRLIIRVHHQRYRNLKWAMRLLLFSMVPFCVSVITLLTMAA